MQSDWDGWRRQWEWSHAANAVLTFIALCCLLSRLCGREIRLPFGLASGDGGFALEQEAGAFDDRHIDHLAIDGDGADPFGERLVIGGDNAAGVVELLGAGAELLVEDRHLARMDDRG